MACGGHPSASDLIRDNLRRESEEVRSQRRQDAVNRARKNFRETEDQLKSVNDITVKQLTATVARIKQSNRTTHLDLRALKQALNEPKNITEFLKITGGLHAVVGHLTGRKALHQLEAAYICCNLATGNEFSCETVSNAAGAYLIEFLDGQNAALQVACLWTLGNLAAGSVKSMSILKSQGLIGRLMVCLQSRNTDVIQATLETFCQVLKSCSSESTSCDLSGEERQELARIALQITGRVEVDWLLYLLSCKPDCDYLFLEKCVPQNHMDKLSEICKNTSFDVDNLSALQSATALVRFLGNLVSGENGQAAQIVLSHQSFLFILSTLLQAKHDHLRQESTWLGVNLLNHPMNDVASMAKSMDLGSFLTR